MHSALHGTHRGPSPGHSGTLARRPARARAHEQNHTELSGSWVVAGDDDSGSLCTPTFDGLEYKHARYRVQGGRSFIFKETFSRIFWACPETT
jgi:hypothetical protein